ncbi:MAG: phospho-sugar mutase, partial [Anaerococcus sp.]|nr:phospho-sugar mutase [Anaerococcus sp.]
LAGLETVKIIDYKLDETGLPKSNVLKYYFEDDSWVAIRPSGTEPKIKLYINAVSKDNLEIADSKKQKLIDQMQEIIDSIE